MKVKYLLKGKKLWILISILLAVVITICVVLLTKEKTKSPETGKAFFYNFPAKICDSITDLRTTDEQIASLFILANSQDSLIATKDFFSGFFFFEYNGQTLLNQQNDSCTNKLIRGIHEKELRNLFADSIKTFSSELLNTISDTVVLLNYYNYQTDLLVKHNINALLIDANIPEKLDSIAVKLISDRLKIKLDILHKNNILSILHLDKIDTKDEKSEQYLQELYSNIINSGLCGIIISESEQLNYFSDFDGLVFKLTKLGETINENLICSTNAFILYDEKDINSLKNDIKKHTKKKDIFLKSSKFLRASMWANQKTAQDSTKQLLDLNLLEARITEASITLLKNSNNLIPISDINQKIHILIASKSKYTDFINIISNYINNYTVSYFNTDSKKPPVIPRATNTLIVLYDTNFSDSIHSLLKTSLLEFKQQKIFLNFGKLSSEICEIDADAILQTYDDSFFSQSFVAQAIFGGVAIKGSLANKLNDSINYGHGIKTTKTRLKYSVPEEVGLNSEILLKIDSILNYAISSGVFPGCQIFVAKNGVVVHNKSYGYLDYSKTNSVKSSVLYDVASLTKICATTLATMKMYETDKINLNDKLSKYFKNTSIDYGNIKPDTLIFIDTISIKGKSLSEIEDLVQDKDTIHLNDTLVELTEIILTKTTPKSNIFQVPVRALLVHQSGISPSLPILKYMFYLKSYKEFLQNEHLKTDSLDFLDLDDITQEEAFDFYYSKKWIKDSAELKIAENMYLKKRWQDSLYEDVKRLGTFKREVYQYTDMNMILMQAIIDTTNEKSLDVYVKTEFYKNLGMNNTTFLPLEQKIPKTRIAPTENEKFWRKQVIHGNVHDPSAAMLGGISGNAGLFSTASDLGILGQMWLNGGTYGGKRYLKQNTIKMFSSTQPENHRGLGFDKVSIKNLNAASAPATTFGHTGFTGCAMWIDPENEIVYVFLSNRIHPDVNNKGIYGQNIVRKTHQCIYDAMIKN
ncbi:MAG TPA: serine hydrolase [Bacteroidales bacterium]|nr:serine hydrolase [Bacteroidales bacterium]HQB22302.1 serine hydrolase [Bacteroidales bacterium]